MKLEILRFTPKSELSAVMFLVRFNVLLAAKPGESPFIRDG